MGWSWRVLRAGAFKLDAGAMFGIVPRPLWSKLVEADDAGRIPLQTNCLLLERDGQLVLIEAGIGDKFPQKQRSLFAMEERCVLDALREVDCRPEDITAVVITHMHFDHAGGLTRLNGAGAAISSFPNARIITQRREWEDALANKSTMHSTYLRDHLDPIAEQVVAVEGEAEALPGLRVMPVPGHTWGQQAALFEDSKGRTIVFPGDVMPTVNHVGLTYNMAYDVLPYDNMATKRRLLERASEKGWLVALGHDPVDSVVTAAPRMNRPGAYELTPTGLQGV